VARDDYRTVVALGNYHTVVVLEDTITPGFPAAQDQRNEGLRGEPLRAGIVFNSPGQPDRICSLVVYCCAVLCLPQYPGTGTGTVLIMCHQMPLIHLSYGTFFND